MSFIKRVSIVLPVVVYGILFVLLKIFIIKGEGEGIVVCQVGLSVNYIFLALRLVKGEVLKSKESFIALVVTGILLRFLFAGTSPETLSDDFYRYYWDGRVQAAGINPYIYAPDDIALDHLKGDDYYEKVNHRSINTIYPPAAQFIFLGGYLLAGKHLWGWKILYLVFDLAGGFFLYKMIKGDKYKKRSRYLLYHLSGLLIIEVYIGMHLDLFGVFFMILSLYLLFKKRIYSSLLLLSLSVLIKYVSFILIPVYFLYYYQNITGPREPLPGCKNNYRLLSLLKPAGFFLLITGIAFLPYLDSGLSVFKTLLFYNRFWTGNSFIPPLIDFMAGELSWLVRGSSLILFLILILHSPSLSFISRFRLSMLCVLLLNGTFYPWYLLWIIPFLVVELQAGELYLLAAVPLSYTIYMTYRRSGIWEENWVIKMVEYIPFFVLLSAGLAAKKYDKFNSSKNREAPAKENSS